MDSYSEHLPPSKQNHLKDMRHIRLKGSAVIHTHTQRNLSEHTNIISTSDPMLNLLSIFLLREAVRKQMSFDHTTHSFFKTLK